MTKMIDDNRITITALPDGYTIRPATIADLQPTVDMLNLCSQALYGTDDHSTSEILNDWQFPGFDLDSNTQLVLAPDGQPVGYAALWDIDSSPVRIWYWGRVHPHHRTLGIGTHLSQWAEVRARRSIARAPQDTRVVLIAGAESIDQPSATLLDDLGFVEQRTFWRMVVELDQRPPEPVWPHGITVHTVAPGQDERLIFHVVRESFKDHWGFVEQPFEEGYQQWRHELHRDDTYDPSLLFLAMDGEQIVGVSLCQSAADDDPDMGWVGTLGILRPWRRKGLALALLHHSFGDFYRRGSKRVGLGVDASNLTGATRLYEKAGMQPVRQLNLYEKELRPGRDLATQSLDS